MTCCLFVWVRCAEIQPGDVVLDPLCGGGSISIEVSELTLHWNSSNPDSNSNPDSKWDKSREVALLNYMQEQLEKCVLIREVLERGSTITQVGSVPSFFSFSLFILSLSFCHSSQGSLAWPETHHIAGDIHHLAVQRAAANIESLLQEMNHGKEMYAKVVTHGSVRVILTLPPELCTHHTHTTHTRNHVKVDVCQWDVCQLPLRTSTVDVVVTDLVFAPFPLSLSHSLTLAGIFL